MRKQRIFFYCLIFSTFLFISCRDKVVPDCGCESEIVYVIPDSAGLIGTISYKKQLDPNDDFYNNKFWIGYVEQNCSNCVHVMIVCNEEMLSDFNDLLNLPPGELVTVKFSGRLKKTCKKTFHPADHTYNHIILTKIERQ